MNSTINNSSTSFGMNLKFRENVLRKLTPELLNAVKKSKESVASLEPLKQDLFIMERICNSKGILDLHLSNQFHVGPERISECLAEDFQSKSVDFLMTKILTGAQEISRKYNDLKSLEGEASEFIAKRKTR